MTTTATTTPAPATDVYVLVLGTAQDGGLPHIGCERERCTAARQDRHVRRLVSSLLLCDPRNGARWLFDATPDLREQFGVAVGHPPKRAAGAHISHPALFDGVFLTHAHIGHYTGLIYLGRESYGSKGLPVYATQRMGGFLKENAPWSFMIEQGNLELRRLAYETKIQLAPDITVTPIQVVHRDELSDTVAFIIAGPNRKLLFLPDINKWERWGRHIEDVIAGVDVALVDGTFFADGEIKGRSMAEIPHPFIVESLERFAPLPAKERRKIIFTHLNHTNPANDGDSNAAQRIRDAGMSVAREAQIFRL